ncbi:hypothetical protein [Spiroplasma endosymbiont of Aleiodes alternator]|uniref:hypothetical protein n=1 Tax=Spiroplasma endosymbiont of Aleiodes alternator TaxID=3139329 RepID=UPI003CCAFA99
MNTFLKVFLTQRLQFCVYFILDVQNNTKNFGTLIVNLNDNKTSIDEISVPYQRQSIPQNYYQHMSLEMNE